MRIISTRGKTPQQVADELAAPGSALAAEQESAVRAIVADVRARGDAAVLEYTRRFDSPEMTAAKLAVTEREFAAARGMPVFEGLEGLRAWLAPVDVAA